MKRLESLVRADLRELARLDTDTVARKVQLGEHLNQAHRHCSTARGSWTAFLRKCEISERTAREAIQFFRNKPVIDGMRHRGAALTVTDVRLVIARPRVNRTIVAQDDQPAIGHSETLALPAPVIDQGIASVIAIRPKIDPLPVSSGEVASPDAEAVKGLHTAPLEPVEPLTPTTTAPDSVAPVTERTDEEIFLELCDAINLWVDWAISRLDSPQFIRLIPSLRSAVNILIVNLPRLEMAIDALHQDGESDQ